MWPYIRMIKYLFLVGIYYLSIILFILMSFSYQFTVKGSTENQTMPERSQYTNRVESERPRRERDSSHDRERSRYEGREWERERNGDHGKRERRERSSGNDISGREKDYYERQRDTTSFSSNDPTDHRSSHLQEYSEQ